MNELKKHSLLLGIVALLIIVKFIVLPVIEWQNTTVEANQGISKRLIKVKHILNNQTQSESMLARQSKKNDMVKMLFHEDTNPASFKLKMQQIVEKMLKDNEISITNFGWKKQQNIEVINAEENEFQIRFKGKLVDVITLMSKLEIENHLFNITGFNFDVKRQNKENLGYVTGRITIAIYRSINVDKSKSEFVNE